MRKKIDVRITKDKNPVAIKRINFVVSKLVFFTLISPSREFSLTRRFAVVTNAFVVVVVVVVV